MIEVSYATSADASTWEEFLSASPKRHHALSWPWSNVFPKVFGHKAFMLMAKDNGKVVGICPLYEVKSMLFGRSLVSVPYLNAGGILAESEEAGKALLEKSVALGAELRLKYVEFRCSGASEHFVDKLPAGKKPRVTMVLPLPSDPEQLFASFTPKLRSQIRRPSKAGYFAQVSGIHLSEEESVNAFFKVFSEHMRDLGTPTYPKELYAQVQSQFGKRCRIVTVWKDNEPAAAGLTIGSPKIETPNGSADVSGNSSAEIPWAASLKRFHKDSPNMLLYWEAIKTACTDGYENYDFGRSSPNGGTYKFKEQWGAKPIDLHWYYQIYSGSVPDVSPNNPKFEFMVRCWKKLPLGLANKLGPWLSKSIP